MKKFFSLVAVLCASVALMASTTVTFDFSDASVYGFTNPAAGAYTEVPSGTVLTQDGVTLTTQFETGNGFRFTNNQNTGAINFRAYITANFEIACPEGKVITTIAFNGFNLSTTYLTTTIGSYSAGLWIGEEDTVLFNVIKSTVQINTLSVTYGDPGEGPAAIDTVGVTEARARIEVGQLSVCYVKGVVVTKPSDPATYGNTIFWMTDIENPTDSLEGYKIRGYNDSAFATNADIPFGLGDTVLLYANALSLYQNSIYEINEGHLVEILGKASYQVLSVTYGEAIYHGQMPNAWEFSLVLSAAEEELPMIDLRFNSANEHGISGSYSTFHSVVYTNENGTPLSADNVALTLSLASVSANDYNIYNIELFFDVNETHYRYEGQLEIAGYTEGYDDNYSLSGDRPFIPQAGDTLTCAQARKYTLSLPMSDVTTDEFTIVGYVTNTNGTVSRNQQVFWIDDQRGTSQTVQAYYCNVPNGNALLVDTKVAITGKLMNYNNTIAEIINGTATIIDTTSSDEQQLFYIVGDFNNWDEDAAVEMVQTSDSTYSVQLDTLYGDFIIKSALTDYKAESDFNSLNIGNTMFVYSTSTYGRYNIYVADHYSNAVLTLSTANNIYRLTFVSADWTPSIGYTFSSNNLWYRVTGNEPNTVEVSRLYDNDISSIVIPDSVLFNGAYYVVNAIGESAFEYSELTSVTIPQSVLSIGARAFEECIGLTSVTLLQGIQSIGNYAFEDCINLTSITIPESLTLIGENAFLRCSNLTSVTWNAVRCEYLGTSDNYRPFNNCNRISSFTFGPNVKKIPGYLCYHMTGLTTLTIPNSVTAIGAHAFAGCDYFNSLIINENVDTIGHNAFGGCDNLTAVTWNPQNCAVGYYESHYHYDEDGNEYYTNDWRDATASPFPSSVQTFTFGNNVQTIPNYLCANLNQVTSISIPNGVTKIGNGTFYNCAGLASVTMPNSVKRIEAETFRNCTSLASINLSNILDYIGSEAFVNTGLMSVMIPESLDTIVYDAFNNNSNLSLVIWNARNCANVRTSQNWNSQLQEYEYSYYESTSSPFPSSVETFIFGDNVQKVPSGLCSDLNQLTAIALPNTVRTIGNSAFYRCSGLISFTMENGVQTIGNDAFYGCSNLPQIVMPNTVTKIGESAFSRCSNLTTAIVGNSVDTIGGSAFSYCKRLISIELPATVNYIGGSAFYNCTSMNKAIIRSTAELDPYCMLLLNPQIDTIIAPASIFDIDEQHRLSYVCTKRMKYVKANSGELTEDAFVVIRRSASTLETLDVSATTNTTIADEAFSNMYRLTTLGLPQGLDRISYKAVAECVRLQSIDIPAGITEIGDRAFEDCRSLTTITFGGQSGATADVALQTIGNWAFYNNHALQQLTIPAGVTTIGAGAFYGCTYLEDLAMPASLRNVGDNAFALCNHLTKMQVEADLPPMVAARTFFDVSRNIPVYVPDEAVNDYRNTVIWQEFFIRPISQAATGIETVRESDSDSQNEMLPDGKFMEDGRLLIRRNGKTYDAQGRLIR